MEHMTDGARVLFERNPAPAAGAGFRSAPRSMLHVPFSSGFSIIEMLVVIAVAAIVTAVAVGSFSKAPALQALDKQTSVVLSLLEDARAKTLSAKNASVFGVHFEAVKAVLFAGPTYSPSAAGNVVEPVHSRVRISSIALAGGGSDVVFNRLVGDTAQAGTVTLSLAASSTQSRVITITATGVAYSN